MTNTKLALVAALALISIAAPAQAATRNVEIGMDTFANRCVSTGGVFDADAGLLSCQTATTLVECEFATEFAAACRWPGIDHQIAVNRVIGQGSAESIASTGEGSVGKGKGGGIKLPDLPIKWK